MKVYIITKEPIPIGMAATQRIFCYARAIQSEGIECEIWNFTRTEVYGQQPNNTEGSGCSFGVRWNYIGGTPLRGSHVFIRQLHDKLDKWRMLRFLNQNLRPGDGILFYCGLDVEFTLRAMKVCKKKRAFAVRDLCELPYGTGAETKEAVTGRKITYERQFPKLDGIISISDTLCMLAKKYVRKDCRIIKVPIMVDYEQYKLDDYSRENTTPYIFHSGTLYEQKDGILGMIEAFGKACRLLPFPIKFVCTGSPGKSPHKKEIEIIIKKYDLQDKIYFTGYLNKEELKKYLSTASLVIINKYKTQQNSYCFSTKLGEYLAAAKPLIITQVGEAMNYLKKNINAYIIEPENVDLLAETITHAFLHDDESHRIGKNGQICCKENFDFNCHAKALSDFFLELSRAALDVNK